MHLGMAECYVPFSGLCDLDLVYMYNNHVWSISLILFQVGIPNLVCGCILGWRRAVYHLPVAGTLTSDLVFRIIVS